ncbi:MAG: preprotein translocase subunit SecY [Puniceicoccales bacterium]|jgi:preprotein translocase subunit SecY|nr:preprotein translocase subunit SecY [Puniceicoccales bacterium]
MFAAISRFLKIADLRQRLFITLFLIFIARIGANIPLPGINPMPLRLFFSDQVFASRDGGLIGLYNIFTGGALLKGAVFGLGIMPYISASIIMQLFGVMMPSLVRLQQEGDLGRQKISMYTRHLTIGICIVQGLLLAAALANYPGRLFPNFDPLRYGNIVIVSRSLFLTTSVFYLTAGTMILIWIGDQISKKGIGSGISLLIVVGILSSFPRSVAQFFQFFSTRLLQSKNLTIAALVIVGMCTLLMVVILAMIVMTQGQRKIPVQHTSRVVNNRMYHGSNSFLPLKINYSGVMPIIFGSALLLFPQQIFAYLGGATGVQFFQMISFHLSQGSLVYYFLYALLIFLFSYLWVAMMFRPAQVADELRKNGGYILGVRPGSATAQFLDFTMTRLTFAGAIFLTAIAVMPDFLYFSLHVPYGVALLFGGTGTLITVGVLLEMMKQVETYLVQRKYDNLLKYPGRGKKNRYLPVEKSHDWAVCFRFFIFPLLLAAMGMLLCCIRHKL